MHSKILNYSIRLHETTLFQRKLLIACLESINEPIYRNSAVTDDRHFDEKSYFAFDGVDWCITSFNGPKRYISIQQAFTFFPQISTL